MTVSRVKTHQQMHLQLSSITTGFHFMPILTKNSVYVYFPVLSVVIAPDESTSDMQNDLKAKKVSFESERPVRAPAAVNLTENLLKVQVYDSRDLIFIVIKRRNYEQPENKQQLI